MKPRIRGGETGAIFATVLFVVTEAHEVTVEAETVDLVRLRSPPLRVEK